MNEIQSYNLEQQTNKSIIIKILKYTGTMLISMCVALGLFFILIEVDLYFFGMTTPEGPYEPKHTSGVVFVSMLFAGVVLGRLTRRQRFEMPVLLAVLYVFVDVFLWKWLYPTTAPLVVYRILPVVGMLIGWLFGYETRNRFSQNIKEIPGS